MSFSEPTYFGKSILLPNNLLVLKSLTSFVVFIAGDAVVIGENVGIVAVLDVKNQSINQTNKQTNKHINKLNLQRNRQAMGDHLFGVV